MKFQIFFIYRAPLNIAVMEKNSKIINILLAHKEIDVDIEDEIFDIFFLMQFTKNFNVLSKNLWRKPIDLDNDQQIKDLFK